MNKEHTDRLFDSFPQIYRGRTESPKTNLMCFGFGCEDGWFNLIWTLSCHIQTYNLNNPTEPQIYATQVKEKFGGLRFYCSHEPKAVELLIQKAEKEAWETCEWCGLRDKTKVNTKGSSWIRTLCPPCKENSDRGHRPWTGKE